MTPSILRILFPLSATRKYTAWLNQWRTSITYPWNKK